MIIMQVDINYLAVLIAVILSQVIGFLWYSKFLFVEPWMRLSGRDTHEGARYSIAQALTVGVITDIVMAYVLAHVLYAFGGNTLSLGLVGGFWTWLGFVATIQLSETMFVGKPLKLFFINAGFRLVSLLAMGAVLASLA
jgi:hypothetical protein